MTHGGGAVEGAGPVMVVIDRAAQPEAVAAVQAFTDYAQRDVGALLGVMERGGRLRSPSQLIAEATITEQQGTRAEALGILATLFERQGDQVAEWDSTTRRAIDRGVQQIDPRLARTWAVRQYLHGVLEWQSAASAAGQDKHTGQGAA